MTEDFFEPPPNGGEAEIAVLGAILLDNGLFKSVASVLEAGDFWSESARAIFEVMVFLDSKGSPIDMLTVGDKLGKDRLTKVGGHIFLASLLDVPVLPSSAVEHAWIIRRRTALRGVVHVAQRITELGMGDVGDLAEFGKFSRDGMKTALLSLSDAVRKVER